MHAEGQWDADGVFSFQLSVETYSLMSYVDRNAV